MRAHTAVFFMECLTPLGGIFSGRPSRIVHLECPSIVLCVGDIYRVIFKRYIVPAIIALHPNTCPVKIPRIFHARYRKTATRNRVSLSHLGIRKKSCWGSRVFILIAKVTRSPGKLSTLAQKLLTSMNNIILTIWLFLKHQYMHPVTLPHLLSVYPFIVLFQLGNSVSTQWHSNTVR